MDQRTALAKNSILHFPGMECVIDAYTGRGSNVIAYRGSYRDHQNPELSHLVLIRELYPFDPENGITRAADGRLIISPSSQQVYDFNKMTFERGNEVHIRLAKCFPSEVDVNINTFEYNNTLYSLLGFTGGRTLDKDLDRCNPQQEQNTENQDPSIPARDTRAKEAETSIRELLYIIRIIKGALGVLQSFHEAGYLHLDISPDNILLIGEGEKERVTLIDYNSVHTMQEIRGRQAVYYSRKEGYTAPEVRRGHISEIREWTDLYSMTAVLYRCLTGTKLTPLQMIGNTPISISENNSVFLQGCPESALSLLRRILRKGLAVSPRRRYQRAVHMIADLTELEDRINGRGITHWALWEKGRKHIRRALQENTALNYILDEKKIYPLYAQTEDGRRISLLEDFWMERDAQEACAPPILLLGGGGMGKTTALFRLTCKQQDRYRPDSTAIYYVSLYGYRDKNPHYICDHLLESLKFKPHTDSVESARRELMQLLDRPVSAGPAFLILLDGLNEAAGDTGPLLEEIHTLSGLAGVQIILTGRSDPGDPAFRKLVLCRLEPAEVRKILADEGILPPENMEVFDLLSFPMLLSMYIRTVQNGEKQLSLGNREQLLQDYFDAILEKEKRDLPPDRNSYMGIEAAVRYLLPEIAALAVREQRALTPQNMFSVTQGCYKEFSRRILTVVYPEWIGHSSELRLGTGSADEWYGQAVLDILWRRLRLLVRDEDGSFRIPHQILEEYLAEQSAVFHEKFDREKRRQFRWGVFLALSAVCVAAVLFASYNAYILSRLKQQHEQLLRQDSEALVRISEKASEAGNRYEALDAAVRALPSETEERPVTTEAEHALASSLRAYQTPSFQVTCSVELTSEARRIAVSPDGKFLITFDRSSMLYCFDGMTGEELWKRIGGAVDSLQILEKEGSVLAIGSDHLASFSLKDGTCIWEKEIICENYLIRDGEMIIVGTKEAPHEILFDENGKFVFSYENEKIVFSHIDLRTGKEMIPAVEILPDRGIGDYDPLHNGKFVSCPDTGICFVLLRKVYGEHGYIDLVLDQIDIADGRYLRTVRLPVDQSILEREWDGHVPYNVLYIPPEMSATGRGGLFFCFDNPVYGEEAAQLTTGFIEDGSFEWNYFEQYEMALHSSSDSLIYPNAAVPVLYLLPDQRIFILYGSELISMNSSGKSPVHRSMPIVTRDEYTISTSFKSSNILMCRYEEDPFSLFVLYEDGSAEYIDQNSNIKKDRILDENLCMACGAGKKSPYYMDDGTFLSSSGCEEDYQDAFCLLQADNKRKVRVVTRTGDVDSKSLTEKEICSNIHDYEDLTGSLLHLMPDGRSLLALYPDTLENSDEYTREMGGFVIDLSDMDIKKRFSFTTSKKDIVLQDISADGKILFFKNHIYELEKDILSDLETDTFSDKETGTFSDKETDTLSDKDTGTLSDADPVTGTNNTSRILPENGQFIRENCAQTYYAAEDGWELDIGTDWDGKTIHWVFKGKEQEISLLDKGENVLEHRVLEYSADFKGDDRIYYSYDEIVSGDNGLLFVRCTNLEKTHGEIKDVDYLMVYSLRTGRWEKISLPEGTAADVMPFPAKSKQLFAIGGADNAVRIYDMDSKEFIMTGREMIDQENIQKMSFILNDRFLAVWEKTGFSIFDVSTGERVFFKSAGRNFQLDDTYSGFVFEEEDILFVTGKAGFCLDTANWEIRYDIPYLACVTQDWIITREKDTITRYPKYSLQDLIRTGRETLKMMQSGED